MISGYFKKILELTLKSFTFIVCLIIILTIPQKILAKPVYIKCIYQGYVKCEGKGEGLCIRPFNSKLVDKIRGHFNNYDYQNEGTDYYVIHNNKLYYADSFSVKSKDKPLVIDNWNQDPDRVKERSTYEYFGIYYRDKGKKHESMFSIYINRINGQYLYKHFTFPTNITREGECRAVKYSRKF